MSELMTAKDRAKHKKVMEQLAAGINPYEGMKSKGPVDRGISVKADISKEELERREKRWKDGVEGDYGVKGLRGERYKAGNYPQAMFEEQSQPIQPKDTEIKCSYCKLPIVGRATYGIGSLRKFAKDEVTWGKNGDFNVDTKIAHIPVKVVACPNCVGNIQPLTKKVRDANGNILHEDIYHQGIFFPESEG